MEVLSKMCSPEWCEFMMSRSEELSFSANEVIFEFDQEAKGIYLIREGKVKILGSNGQGGMRIIRLATKNDFIGHRGFGGDWIYSVQAIALEESKVLFIPLNTFIGVFKANPDFAYNLLVFFADELRDSESFAKLVLVRKAVANALYKNYQVFGLVENSTLLSYNLSRKDLASFAGTTYESLVRILSDFHKSGIISIDGKKIHILDIERLRFEAKS
jgi:CRP/FNR family transcriptional regulator